MKKKETTDLRIKTKDHGLQIKVKTIHKKLTLQTSLLEPESNSKELRKFLIDDLFYL